MRRTRPTLAAVKMMAAAFTVIEKGKVVVEPHLPKAGMRAAYKYLRAHARKNELKRNAILQLCKDGTFTYPNRKEK